MSSGGVALAGRRELTAGIRAGTPKQGDTAMGRALARGADAGRAAEALRLAFSAAYDIGFADGAWNVCRLYGDRHLIKATTPAELTEAILADQADRSAW
jgi:hypothetical protein